MIVALIAHLSPIKIAHNLLYWPAADRMQTTYGCQPMNRRHEIATPNSLRSMPKLPQLSSLKPLLKITTESEKQCETWSENRLRLCMKQGPDERNILPDNAVTLAAIGPGFLLTVDGLIAPDSVCFEPWIPALICTCECVRTSPQCFCFFLYTLLFFSHGASFICTIFKTLYF
jgi:hypothetical protein